MKKNQHFYVSLIGKAFALVLYLTFIVVFVIILLWSIK